MLNFNTLMIGSNDYKKLGDFYGKVFDAKPVFEGDGFVCYQAGAGFIGIGPHSEVSGANSEPGRLILNFETKDVQSEFDRVKAIGAKVVKEPYDMGDESGTMKISTFEDPDGNYFQIVSEWE